MTWIRFLNPLYTLRLEREQVHLARSVASVAQSATLLAKRSDDARAAEAETIQNALTTFDGVRMQLQLIASHMACGKVKDAHLLVDQLIVILKDGHQ